jgi:RNA polymerase sigma-70 factor (ECF subfamily)
MFACEIRMDDLSSQHRYRHTDVPFVAWLYRIAHARTVGHWRRVGRRRELALSDQIAATEGDPEATINARFERADLTAALHRLTDDQQQVIILRFVEGMKLPEVATVMGKTVGAIKSLQHRATASLARLISEWDKAIE